MQTILHQFDFLKREKLTREDEGNGEGRERKDGGRKDRKKKRVRGGSDGQELFGEVNAPLGSGRCTISPFHCALCPNTEPKTDLLSQRKYQIINKETLGQPSDLGSSYPISSFVQTALALPPSYRPQLDVTVVSGLGCRPPGQVE